MMYNIKNLDNFAKLNKAVAFTSGALDTHTKQLMAEAVALTTQCPYCIELHVTEARAAGATEQDLAETAMVAAVMHAGTAFANASHGFEN